MSNDTRLPAAEVAELRRLDVAHHLPGHTDYKLQAELGGSRIINRAEGCMVYDADGNGILDGMAGLWCVTAGYGARGTRARGLRADAAAAVLQHLLQDRHAAGGAPGDGAVGAARWRPQPHLLQQLRLRGHRYRVPAGAALLVGAGPAAAADLHQPHQRLPRLDHRRRQPRRHEGDARPGRPADPRDRTRDAAVPVRRCLRRGSRGVRRPRSARDRGAHPQGRTRERRRVHRRAGAGRGGRHHSAAGLLAAGRGDLPQVRHLAGVDEVICGFGRLGRWFGFQHFGVRPDIVTMAKGLSSGYLPISATAVAARSSRRCVPRAASSCTATPIPDTRRRAPSRVAISRSSPANGWSSAPPRTPDPTSRRRSARLREPPAGRRGALARPDRRDRDRGAPGHQPALRRQGRHRRARWCATSASGAA